MRILRATGEAENLEKKWIKNFRRQLAFIRGLQGFEDEDKTEVKTEIKTSADISKKALTDKKANENI